MCTQFPGEPVFELKQFSNFAGNVTASPPPKRTYAPGTPGRSSSTGPAAAVQEVVAIVKQAEADFQRVRAVGSGWSFSGVMLPQWTEPGTSTAEGYLIQTDALNATLSETMSGTTYNDDPVFLTLTPSARMRSLYHVQAGIKIHDLYCRLDALRGPNGEGTDPSPGGISPNDMKAHGYALPTMGGSGGQSLAGAISTSTHGGDSNAAMSDIVQGIHIVCAGGVEHFIQRGGENTIVDVEALRGANPCLGGCDQIISDDDAFYSVLVSMGRMGVIVSMVLEVVPQFFLEEISVKSTWETLKGPSPAGQPTYYPEESLYGLHWGALGRFLQIFVLPYADSSGQHTSFVTTRDQTSLPITNASPNRCKSENGTPFTLYPAVLPPPSTGGLFSINTLCEASTPVLQGVVLALINFLVGTAGAVVPPLAGLSGLLASVPPLVLPLEDVLLGPAAPIVNVIFGVLGLQKAVTVSVAVTEAATEAVKLLAPLVLNSSTTVGQYLAVAFEIVAQNGSMSWAEQLVNAVLSTDVSLSQPPASIEYLPGEAFPMVIGNPSKVDISYQVMDTIDYKGPCLDRVLSLEVAFNSDLDGYIEYIDQVLALIDAAAAKTRYLYGGYISLRYCRGSSALLAIEQWFNTVCIETTVLRGDDNDLAMLTSFENAAQMLGATVHWGQLNSRSQANVESVFPAIERWRATLARLSKQGNPYTFDNDFCNSHGLEVLGAIAPTVPCDTGRPPFAVPQVSVGPVLTPIEPPRIPPLPTIHRLSPVYLPLPPGPLAAPVTEQRQALTGMNGAGLSESCDCNSSNGGREVGLPRKGLGCSLAYLASPRAATIAGGADSRETWALPSTANLAAGKQVASRSGCRASATYMNSSRGAHLASASPRSGVGSAFGGERPPR